MQQQFFAASRLRASLGTQRRALDYAQLFRESPWSYLIVDRHPLPRPGNVRRVVEFVLERVTGAPAPKERVAAQLCTLASEWARADEHALWRLLDDGDVGTAATLAALHYYAQRWWGTVAGGAQQHMAAALAEASTCDVMPKPTSPKRAVDVRQALAQMEMAVAPDANRAALMLLEFDAAQFNESLAAYVKARVAASNPSARAADVRELLRWRAALIIEHDALQRRARVLGSHATNQRVRDTVSDVARRASSMLSAAFVK